MRTVYSDLHKARLNPTTGRVAVLTVFHDRPDEHLTADQVFHRLSQEDGRCGLSSVYRTLSNLLEAGLVSDTWVGGTRMVYELNRGTVHSHLVCERCGLIRDVEMPSLHEQHVSLAHRHGFSFSRASLVVFGLCAECAALS